LSVLLSDLPPSCHPEIRVDCPDEIKFRVVEEVARIVAPQARR